MRNVYKDTDYTAMIAIQAYSLVLHETPLGGADRYNGFSVLKP